MKDVLLKPASLNTPANDGVDLAIVPSWILLDFTAYVTKRRNNTTATCKFMGDKELQVTFFPAHPPRVSYFCVYSPDLKPSHYAVEPKIIATEANVVLLRIVIGGACEVWSRSAREYFIYKAGGRNQEASLEQLPQSRPYYFHDGQVGLLAGNDDTGGYTVAALLDDSSVLDHVESSLTQGQYRVCILDSKDKVWTIKIVFVPRNQQQGFYHETSKVITIGGKRGTMAFVDLWRGILEYDVLGQTPLLRYTQLPETFPGCREYRISPLHTRDIAFVSGRIKYVEMAKLWVKMSTGYDGWMAATWSIPAITSQHDWRSDGKIEAATIHYDENLFRCTELPKMLKCSEGKSQPLENLRTGHPTLSLRDDDIVYFMTKVKPRDRKACVIAVNMRQGTIQEVARFGARRIIGLNFTYIQSRISNYLNIAPVNIAFRRLTKGTSTKFLEFGLPSRPCFMSGK